MHICVEKYLLPFNLFGEISTEFGKKQKTKQNTDLTFGNY